MSNKILVTDSLFIFDEHVEQLKAEGYAVERLDKPNASEEELAQAIKGKIGYILGGIERITPGVIEAANELKAISFTGSDYKEFIPGWKLAKEKGIAITNTPGANSSAVSEFALSVALAMQRNLFELGRTGNKKFQTTQSFVEAKVGIIGAGHIGRKIINLTQAFKPKQILYTSNSEKSIEATFVELEELLQESDIIFLAVPGSAGEILNKDRLNSIKKNALLVSISPLSTIDTETLFDRLQTGTLRAAIDWPAPSDKFKDLPLYVWFNTNDHTAYNTIEANRLASDMAVKSLLNVLNNGEDKHRVI